MRLLAIAVAAALIVLPCLIGIQPTGEERTIQSLNQTVDARLALRLSRLKADSMVSVNLAGPR